jgi:hypothetical protein
MTLEDQIWQISLQNPAGFTRYTYGLNAPAQGYCVGYIDTQNCFGRYGLKRALAHAQTHSQVIGGWRHGGRYYFDSVRVYITENAAIEAAIRERQIGYFDLAGHYRQVMNNAGQLLPQFQALLNRLNQQRRARGMKPFQLLT